MPDQAPQTTQGELPPDLLIRFGILVPLVQAISEKRVDDRWGDESKLYGKAVEQIETEIANQREQARQEGRDAVLDELEATVKLNKYLGEYGDELISVGYITNIITAQRTEKKGKK